MAVLAGTNYRVEELDDTQAGIGQAVFLFVFNTFFAIGWLGMTWLYPAEIVPLRIRAPTNALSTRYRLRLQRTYARRVMLTQSRP